MVFETCILFYSSARRRECAAVECARYMTNKLMSKTIFVLILTLTFPHHPLFFGLLNDETWIAPFVRTCRKKERDHYKTGRNVGNFVSFSLCFSQPDLGLVIVTLKTNRVSGIYTPVLQATNSDSETSEAAHIPPQKEPQRQFLSSQRNFKHQCSRPRMKPR